MKAKQISVITGTTHGIGRVTAHELARAGRHVVMLCRDVRAANGVRDEIIEQIPSALVDVVHCDLASLTSVRQAAAVVSEEFGCIELLINNAGMTSATRRASVDGFELTFATNHLGPFLLTSLLMKRLTSIARIVNVASCAHFRCKSMDLDRIADPHAPYNAVAVYDRSKLANVLHTFALARRLSGSAICVNCLHPGVVATNLLPRWLRFIKPFISDVIDVERGALTTLHVALSAEVAGKSGLYFDNNAPCPASSLAKDVQLQESLWIRSNEWIGIEADMPG